MGHLSNRRSFASPTQLWLAAMAGRALSRPAEAIHPVGEPETPLEVEFIGITEAEQRAALAGFPGGRRFILVKRS
ncbi:MAG TPA: hypothetical protein PK286_10435 [Devosia sp.]|nr:hypothetical protein [Devosia sp.]